MPRKAKDQCSKCAKPMVRYPDSALVLMCRACRDLEIRVVLNNCSECGKPSGKNKTCSHECHMSLLSKNKGGTGKRPKCEVCSKTYRRKEITQRTCSRECGVILKGHKPGGRIAVPKIWIKQCDVCQSIFTATGHGASLKLRCSEDCVAEYSKNYRDTYMRTYKRSYNGYHQFVRRNRLRLQTKEIVDTRIVIDRDKSICHLCNEVVNEPRYPRDPMGPSLDHIVPLSKGGEHSYANVKLAHFNCNSRRRNVDIEKWQSRNTRP